VSGRCSPENALANPTFVNASVPGVVPMTTDGLPPCCLSLLRDMLLQFGDTLLEHRIPYFAHYGSLLGLLRGDGIIPWTSDVGMLRVSVI
jgi:hypothetical protein